MKHTVGLRVKNSAQGNPLRRRVGLKQLLSMNLTFMNVVFGSKLETAKKFCNWVFTQVLPSIRKYGQYKLFDNPNNKMFKIENETDLHCKVVHLIRNYYPKALTVTGLGESQDTLPKRINSWKKGYTKGQPDLMALNYHKDYKQLMY